MNRRILAAALVAIFASPLNAQDWTRFRGPGGSGLSDAGGIPAAPDADAIRWETDLPGTGHSSPVLWGDTLFLTASEDGKRALLAIDAATGDEKWRRDHEFTPYNQHRFNDYASSTACVDAERVYLSWTSPDGVQALAYRHDGEPAWKVTLGKFSAQHGSAASPVLAGGHLLVASLGEAGGSFIVGLDPATGDEKWRLERESSDKGSYCTPIVRELDGGGEEAIYTSTAHGITSIDPATGAVRWEHPTDFSQRCVAAPVVSGDIVFSSAGSGGGGKESCVVNIANGKPQDAWEAGRKGLPYVPSGIAFKGLLFLLNDGGVMTCIRASDGEELWQERAVGAPYASPIIVGDTIYCCSKEGELATLKASDKFEPVGSYTFPDGIYATPAVAGGKMYIRTFSKLYCVGGE